MVSVTESVGTPDGPEHPGPLEKRTDHGLAAGLDDVRADKPVLAAKLGIAAPRHYSVRASCHTSLPVIFMRSF